ncbi:hypothetical protein FP2506_06321 [Fulvimarina pelagi HTCC2506]|uniref:Uncharacterized protein n=1 Tax=Fulvimarina pelagi HTCC2506 TaxID=314231 RepID=Q0G7D2_9HYPH|nr:hypothetical protein FP2506_06321 [Fulvimarina pelagi HTCC2506]
MLAAPIATLTRFESENFFSPAFQAVPDRSS